MSDFPRNLDAHGLFGYLDPSVKLRLSDRITILTGPNGSGKTHVLRLLRDLVAPDVRALARLPVDAVTLDYESGKSLAIRRVTRVAETEVRFMGSGAMGESYGPVDYTISLDPLEGVPLPDFIERYDEDGGDWGGDLWVDTRDGEVMSAFEVLSRYSNAARRRSPAARKAPADWPPDWIRLHFTPSSPPTFIETARLELNTPATPTPRTQFHSATVAATRQGAAARVRQYVDRIRAEVAEARRESLSVSQRADQEFALHALDKARESVKEAELRDRWQRVAALHLELHGNGLTPESPDVAFPINKTTPTERRILNIFLMDWEEKLAPLVPVHQKVQLLREIVGEKLRGKSLEIENGEPHFISEAGHPISVEMLSSGEQHLLALFTMLLFAASQGSLVLIDEPEISLHAAWKHAFLDDVGRVAAINNLQIVLATHSTAIINGRWELVEELALSR